MYVIIEAKGKQYRVKEGEIIHIDRMNLLESASEAIEFKNVLFFYDGEKMHVGAPYVQNCVVQAQLLGEIKGPKVLCYKYKRRKNYHKKKGHRQKYSQIKIVKIMKQEA